MRQRLCGAQRCFATGAALVAAALTALVLYSAHERRQQERQERLQFQRMEHRLRDDGSAPGDYPHEPRFDDPRWPRLRIDEPIDPLHEKRRK